MKTRLLRALAWSALLAFASGCSTAGSEGANPEDVLAGIREATQTVREDWQRDAMLVSVLIERPDAQTAFRYRYVFAASSSPTFMQLTKTPLGTEMTDYGVRTNVESVPGTKVMDLARAVGIARSAGMKGNLLTAELRQWTSDALDNVSVPVVIWRLVPDDDPNLADPNDPNMKNYYVDALLGTVYNADQPDARELIRGSEAFGAATTAEMMEFIQSLQRSR